MVSRRSGSGRGSRPNRGNLGRARGNGASTAAKIGLIAGTATVLASLINKESSHTPPAATTLQVAEEKTVTEQVHTSNPAGAPTFPDSRAFKRQGPPVKPGQRVEVACRFLDPKAVPNWQSDWWYVVASPPYNGQFYTPAIFYLNGDPPGGPYGTEIDGRVPVCQ
jgi:hypothetical protein